MQAALAGICGTGAAGNGTVIAIVDAAGHLRDLKLTRDALRWGDRLPSIILEATAAAENDAATKTEHAMLPLTGGERVEDGILSIRETFGQPEPRTAAPTSMTDEEIQAADDAYFERINRRGWNS